MDFEKIDVKNKISRVVNNEDKKILPFKNQDFETLKRECLKNGKLFEDPLFQPVDKNLFYTQSIPYGTKWMRPKEISSNPLFIDGEAHAHDLDQGYLGNCWFLAGCTAIVLIPELFANVVPPNQEFGSSYAGIFHFNFWYYGQWVSVVIDDKLPVNSSKKLIFCSNKQQPNEFWAALLEKAYAKLCGSYENLDGGSTTDALIDMTGGIQETFEIKDKQTDVHKKEMWDILVKSRQHKSLIGASIAPNPRVKEARLSNGLVMGHAYTVTQVAALQTGSREIKIIRVRNPWGNEVEWKGAWSDRSYEWNTLSNEIKTALKYQNLPDGEFWMSFDDFYRNFETVQFCDLTPDAMYGELLKKMDQSKSPKLTWKLTSYNDKWEPGKTSGGCGKGNDAKYWTNPQFLVTLTDQDPGDNENMATVIVSLLQKYTRQKRTSNKGQSAEEFIQFRIYKILNLKDAENAKKTGQRLYASQLEKIAVSGPYINLREVTLRLRAVPGNYLIIPSCYDADISGEFLLRLYTEVPIEHQHVSILHDHKDDLSEKDLFFSNPKSLDDAFSSWTNLLSNTNEAKSADIAFSRLKLGNNEAKPFPNINLTLNGSSLYTSFSRFYNFSDDDIFNKIEHKTSNKNIKATIRRLF